MASQDSNYQFPALIRMHFEAIAPIGNQKKRAFIPVFKCRHIRSGKPAVIKWIQKESTDPKSMYSLLNESNFSFEIEGLPSGVQVIQDEKTLAVVRDYREGEPLDEFWKKIPDRRKMETIKRLSNELVSSMRVLDRKRIVHCDIKPSNLLIKGTIDAFKVELIDFGLAIEQGKLPERKTLFPLGYAAPELILNQLSLVDQRTDVFSFGILIWRLLTGQLPLYHPNPSIYTNLQLTHPLTHHSSIPNEWAEFLTKSCAKPFFSNSPNRIPENEVYKQLEDAMNKRFVNFNALNDRLQELPVQESWLRKFINRGLF